MLFIISIFAPLFCVWRWFWFKHIAKIGKNTYTRIIFAKKF